MRELWFSINDGVWQKSCKYRLDDNPLSAQSAHTVWCCLSNEVAIHCVGRRSLVSERHIIFGYMEGGEIKELQGWQEVAEQHYRSLENGGWRY